MNVICTYGWATLVCSARGGQKRGLDPVLPMVLTHHVGAGNRTSVLYKSSPCFYVLNHLNSDECCGFESLILDGIPTFIK